MAKKAAPKKPTPKKPAPKKAAPKSAAPATDFQAVFARLRAILVPYAPAMIVVKDTPEWYYLDTKAIGPNKRPVCFAAARLGKAYVSFYLMPLYMNAPLEATLSPGLRKRHQGKSCFNFTAEDDALFAELAALTAAGHACFRKLGYV